jgi:hypothetical protein
MTEEAPMARTRRQTRRQIVRDAEGRLAPSYTLMWLSYDEQLSDEQIVRLLDGDFESVEEDIDAWAAEYRWGRVREIVRDLVGDENLALIDCTAEYDELRIAVEERDESDLLAGLIRNSHPRLWRYSLDYDLDPGSMTWDEPEFVQAMRDISEVAGIDLLDNASALGSLVNNAPYGGSLYVLWHGDAEDILTAVLDSTWGNDRAPTTIEWRDPHLLVLDGLNGSGADARVKGTVRVPFRPERVRLDAARGHGYTWTEVACPHPAGYEATVTLTAVERSGDGADPNSGGPVPAIASDLVPSSTA